MEQEIAASAENFRIVRERVSEAAERSGRSLADIRLIAVTKFVETERILPAIEAGCLEVGENRAQELCGKLDFFRENGQKVHFIGKLQLNKLKYLVGRVDLIQSADRPEAFAEIERLAKARETAQDVLVEVNIGEEPQKGGMIPSALPELISMISDMPHVRLKGLMCIPPAADGEGARVYFRRMRELFEDIGAKGPASGSMEILSMGMSADYAVALEEGSNMVRIGSAIFGPRQRH